MDREISVQELQKRKKNRIIRIATALAVLMLLFLLLPRWLEGKIPIEHMPIGTVDKGPIEISIAATGKLVPLSEEIIGIAGRQPDLGSIQKSGRYGTRRRTTAKIGFSFGRNGIPPKNRREGDDEEQRDPGRYHVGKRFGCIAHGSAGQRDADEATVVRPAG